MSNLLRNLRTIPLNREKAVLPVLDPLLCEVEHDIAEFSPLSYREYRTQITLSVIHRCYSRLETPEDIPRDIQRLFARELYGEIEDELYALRLAILNLKIVDPESARRVEASVDKIQSICRPE